jgi:hypothetical protein
MHEAREMDLTLPLVDIAQALARASYPGDDRERYQLWSVDGSDNAGRTSWSLLMNATLGVSADALPESLKAEIRERI